MADKGFKKAIDSSERVADNNYDRGITPAETGARMAREGDSFKTIPSQERDEEAATDDQTNDDSLDTAGGYTVDKEGLLNNYAVEPEMYYEVPGDARQEAKEDVTHRAEELAQVNEDKEGELTMEDDKRGRGPGAI